jgi:hypothetical protein
MAGGMFREPRPTEFVMNPPAGSEVRRQIARVERQIEYRAERKTNTAKAKARPSRRCRAGWTPADERLFREHVERLTFERRDEIEALS